MKGGAEFIVQLISRTIGKHCRVSAAECCPALKSYIKSIIIAISGYEYEDRV